MARNEIEIAAAPARVYSVLSDPRRYSDFVVGTRMIRRYDSRFPEPGTRIHHAIGIGPLALRDCSRSVVDRAPHELQLEVGVGVVGKAMSRFELEAGPDGTTTRLVMVEEPVDGPLARLWRPAVDALMHLRNRSVVKRIRRIAELREARATEAASATAAR